MSFKKLLIANRGEIAIRIARARPMPALRLLRSIPPTMRCRCMCALPTKPLKSPAAARAPISTSLPSCRPAKIRRLRCRASRLRRSSARTRRSQRPARLQASPSWGQSRPRWSCSATRSQHGAGKALRRSDHCGYQRAVLARGDHGVLRIPRQGRCDRDQGDGRWRRPRHARRGEGGGSRRGLRALPVGSQGGVRLRRRLCRAADPQGPPHRGADHRRPAWRDQPSLGARMHHPAPPPEAGGGGAEPLAQRHPARPHHRGSEATRDALRPTTISARSSSWSTAPPRTASPSSRPIRGSRSSTP